MLGRASARVDENSRKRMKALGERARGPKRSLIKGKERLCAKTRGSRSMDELGDHTNFVRDVPETSTVHYSSLPIMLESQSKDTAAEYKNDVHVHSGTSTTATATLVAVPAPGNDGIKPPVSTRPQNRTQLFPPRATLSTRHSQKRIEPPSPTPVRSSTPIPFRPVPAPPAPTPVPAHRPKFDPSRTSDSVLPKSTPRQLPHPSDIHSHQPHPVPTPLPPAVNNVLNGTPAAAAAAAAYAVSMTDSLVRHGRSASASASATTASTTSISLISAHPPPSQTHGHGSKRALGMTRTVPRSFSPSSNNNNTNTPHSAATKKPFRPPLARPSAAATASQATTLPAVATKSQIPPTTSSHSRSHDSQRQRRQEDAGKKGSSVDPDSSFDLSFDFDPEALEAAMKQYD